MQNASATVVILGTGGTIAGVAADPTDDLSYRAAQMGVGQLIAGQPALSGMALESEQVAQIDSKDMSHEVWLQLAQRVAHHLDRADVAGVVVTHGTDTLEEAAWFLQRVLAPTKPVVLTAAMRPATSSQADGPQNLLDAVRLARFQGAMGVLVVLAGAVHSAHDVRKTHPNRLDAFASGEAGPLARLDDGVLRCLRPWPEGEPLGLSVLGADASLWPMVDIVTSHAGAQARTIEALCQAGARGLVIAATGNGTVHSCLEQALVAAQQQGVQVLRATRCLDGAIVQGSLAEAPFATTDLIPVKARVELMLRLM